MTQILNPPINVYAVADDGAATHIGFLTAPTHGGPICIPRYSAPRYVHDSHPIIEKCERQRGVVLRLGQIHCGPHNSFLAYVLSDLEAFPDLCRSSVFRPAKDAAFAVELLSLYKEQAPA